MIIYKGFTIEDLKLDLYYGGQQMGSIIYFIVKKDGLLVTSAQNLVTLQMAEEFIDNIIDKEKNNAKI